MKVPQMIIDAINTSENMFQLFYYRGYVNALKDFKVVEKNAHTIAVEKINQREAFLAEAITETEDYQNYIKDKK